VNSLVVVGDIHTLKFCVTLIHLRVESKYQTDAFKSALYEKHKNCQCFGFFDSDTYFSPGRDAVYMVQQ
jgi:hypothetical protein